MIQSTFHIIRNCSTARKSLGITAIRRTTFEQFEWFHAMCFWKAITSRIIIESVLLKSCDWSKRGWRRGLCCWLILLLQWCLRFILAAAVIIALWYGLCFGRIWLLGLHHDIRRTKRSELSWIQWLSSLLWFLIQPRRTKRCVFVCCRYAPSPKFCSKKIYGSEYEISCDNASEQ